MEFLTRCLCRRIVRRTVYKYLCRSDEDLEQEIYIHLWEKRYAYHEQEKLSAWMRTVSENFCKDYLRRKSQKYQRLTDYDTDNQTETISTDKDPEYYWIEKCRRKLVLNAVDQLPEKMRKALVLVEFEGLSYDAAAKKMGITTGTLKSRIHNAKQKLQQQLNYLIC